MFWLITRFLVFAGLLAIVAATGAYLADSTGTVTISLGGVDYPPLTHIEFLALLAVVLALAWFVLKMAKLGVALVATALGAETALTAHRARSREQRGLSALSAGMIAMAEGDLRRARGEADKAGKLLGAHDMVSLLRAQIAEAGGDTRAAREHYRGLARQQSTAVVGVRGLLGQALREGDLRKALKLAEHAFKLRPKESAVQQGLFELQVRNRAWAGAQETLGVMRRSKTIPEDVAVRRAAILDFEYARQRAAEGDEAEALSLATDAVAELPTLAPVAAFAATLMGAAGQARKAATVLHDAWAEQPQPVIAEALASLEPDETPGERRQRFRPLIEANPDHTESRLLEAELALADEDLPAARRAIGMLASEAPTHRSLALMAAIEKAAGAPEAVVRGYLARAVTAPRGAHWICERCGTAPGQWSAACPNCGGFDTLSWRDRAPSLDDGDPTMLPLLTSEFAGDSEKEDADERV
jgi:HemY protein